MKNQIIYLDEEKLKVFGFDDNLILASSKRHENFDSLLASAEKKGMLETFDKLEMSSITGLEYSEEGNALSFGYTNPKGKNKSTTFTYSVPGTREKIADFVAEMKGFKKEEVQESKNKPLLMNILGLVITIIGTGLFTWISNESAAGVAYDSSGRRGARNEAVYDMLGQIPSEIVILIGVVTFGWLAYKTRERYLNPRTETKYS